MMNGHKDALGVAFVLGVIVIGFAVLVWASGGVRLEPRGRTTPTRNYIGR